MDGQSTDPELGDRNSLRVCGYVLTATPIVLGLSDLLGVTSVLLRHEVWRWRSLWLPRVEPRAFAMSGGLGFFVCGVTCVYLSCTHESGRAVVAQSAVVAISSVIAVTAMPLAFLVLTGWDVSVALAQLEALPSIIAAPSAFLVDTVTRRLLLHRSARSRLVARCSAVALACLVCVVLGLLQDGVTVRFYWSLRGGVR